MSATVVRSSIPLSPLGKNFADRSAVSCLPLGERSPLGDFASIEAPAPRKRTARCSRTASMRGVGNFVVLLISPSNLVDRHLASGRAVGPKRQAVLPAARQQEVSSCCRALELQARLVRSTRSVLDCRFLAEIRT